MNSIAIILAAGAGRRMGGVAKALLVADGGTFLAAIAQAAAGAGADGGLVVVGPPHGEAVEREARRLGLEVVWNPDPDRGMGSSVAIGFAAALARPAVAQVALLWPVDHAEVGGPTLERILAEAGAGRMAIPEWRGRGGHPVAIGRDLWSEMAACGVLPEGARSVIRAAAARDPGAVLRVAVDDPAVVADVDLPADMERVARGRS